MIRKNTHKLLHYIKLCFSILLWFYIIYRAICIPITQDEAHTYLLVKTNNWRQMIGTANTHWLNTAFIKLFLWIPGSDDPWKLRMLSLLAWPIFSICIIKISSRFNDPLLGFIFFIATVANPFLILYFSLSRGYGAACAFTVLAIWKASKLVDQDDYNPVKWITPFFAAAIATLANFSAFYLFIAFTLVYLLQLSYKNLFNKVLGLQSLKLIIVIVGTTLFSAGSLLIMRKYNTLYFGGESNIVNSLYGSIVKASTYFDDPLLQYKTKGSSHLLSHELSNTESMFGWLIFILSSVASLHSLLNLHIYKKLSVASLAAIVCFFILILNATFHILFSTPYLFERTTLIIFLLVVISIFMKVDSILDNQNFNRLHQVVRLFSSALLIFIIYNFYSSFSPKVFIEWPVQTDTKKSLDYLEALKAKKVGMDIWHHDVFINYYTHAYPNKYHFNYKIVSGLTRSETTNCEKLSEFDYLLLNPPYSNIRNIIASDKWTLIQDFHASGTRIYKRNTIH